MNHCRPHCRTSSARRGVVLLIVLVVVVVLALAAYVFCELSISHRRVANAVGRRMQAEAFADSGVQFTLQVVSDAVRSGAEQELYENPGLFQGVNVVTSETPAECGGFTIISPAFSESGELSGIRFGLEDESNRLNLNLLKAIADTQAESGQQMLMALPGMTLEVADSILDWLDTDDEPRPYGVESDYYATLRPPYAAANRELTSIAELLLVRGVTPPLLFGRDRNQNYLIERDEARGFAAAGVIADESSSCGWAAHLTLYSRDRGTGDEDAQAEQAIHVNQDDMQKLYDELLAQYGKPWAMFIVAFRQNGPFDGPATLESAANRDIDVTQPARFPITQALDLIGQNVQVTLAGDSEPIVLASPFKDEGPALEYSLQELQEHFVISAGTLPGRINIMTAPRVVLRAIPGIDDAIVDGIMNHREIIAASASDGPVDELWPLTEGIVTVDQMRVLLPFINLGGAVYRAQILGHFAMGGHAARSEVVIDASGAKPRVVLRRELTHLGNGALLRHVSQASSGQQLISLAR